MAQLDLARLEDYRRKTFRTPGPILRSGKQGLRSLRDALDFVNERGFVYFWPIKGVDLPSLWTAVAGHRPVADKHDDPGHITWGWKDSALDKKIWYYAKVLRRKATIISLETLPFFYALSENYGDPNEDYLLAYEEGRLTQAAKQVYEALLSEGRLNTIDLRRLARLTSANSTSEFNRALEILQADFKVLPVGVSDAGAWHYSHIYDIAARQFPELPEQARSIGESEARKKLLEMYLRSVGAAQARDAERLFHWSSALTGRSVAALETAGALVRAAHPSKAGDWLAVPDVLSSRESMRRGAR
jgi:winged helix DNA-binding protein